MRVVYQKEHGEIRYYFGNCDKVLDFVLDLNMRPIIQLGFMPELLARDKKNCPLGRLNIVSLPENMDQWEQLLRAFFEHIILRYGLQTVRNWGFSPWSKPEVVELPFGFADVREYFEFYYCSYRVVKSYGSDIQFASPAFLIASCGKPWIKEFFYHCKKNDCMPDSLNFDFYPAIKANRDINDKGSDRSYNEVVNELQYNAEPDFMRDALASISKLCKDYKLPYEKAGLEEWNFSVSQRERVHDTCYMASFIAKNVLECWDKFSYMSFWTCADSEAQVDINEQLFHGGMGMIAGGNLKKPSCYAFAFLAKLGDMLISQGDGYIVTAKNQNIQVLFYNYCHYSELFANASRDYPSQMNAYEAFREQSRKYISLTLTGLNFREYMLTAHRLNCEHGSVYDKWLEMGGQEPTAQDEFEYLRGISQPYLHKQRAAIKNGRYQIDVQLEPFELYLIEFKPILS